MTIAIKTGAEDRIKVRHMRPTDEMLDSRSWIFIDKDDWPDGDAGINEVYYYDSEKATVAIRSVEE